MRHAITVGWKHGEKDPVVITGAEVPRLEQRIALKNLRQSREHPEFERIEVWTSAGAHRVRFQKPAVDPVKEAEAAKAKEAEAAKAEEAEAAKAKEAEAAKAKEAEVAKAKPTKPDPKSTK